MLRTTDNKSSLLHYVANIVERKFPHVLEFPDDLSYSIKAARGKSIGHGIARSTDPADLMENYVNFPYFVLMVSGGCRIS